MSEQNNFKIEYNEVSVHSKVIKDSIISPLKTKVNIYQNTWEYHVIGDHTDREFLNNISNYKSMLSGIKEPDLITSDKTNPNRLNYFSLHFLNINEKTTVKPLKIVTEKNEDNTETFVSCMPIGRLNEKFTEGRIVIYDRHNVN